MNRRAWIKSVVATVAIATCPEAVLKALPHRTTVQAFERFAFPRLQKACTPPLVAYELVTVAPMSGPTGLIWRVNLVQDTWLKRVWRRLLDRY